MERLGRRRGHRAPGRPEAQQHAYRLSAQRLQGGRGDAPRGGLPAAEEPLGGGLQGQPQRHSRSCGGGRPADVDARQRRAYCQLHFEEPAHGWDDRFRLPELAHRQAEGLGHAGQLDGKGQQLPDAAAHDEGAGAGPARGQALLPADRGAHRQAVVGDLEAQARPCGWRGAREALDDRFPGARAEVHQGDPPDRGVVAEEHGGEGEPPEGARRQDLRAQDPQRGERAGHPGVRRPAGAGHGGGAAAAEGAPRHHPGQTRPAGQAGARQQGPGVATAGERALARARQGLPARRQRDPDVTAPPAADPNKCALAHHQRRRRWDSLLAAAPSSAAHLGARSPTRCRLVDQCLHRGFRSSPV
mmetsp:Transcript_10112/g.30266  ORF Transcript_10112/g.30266 Transcript_10112/m.30266 type:complete len:358 (+) Transcript_10112:467-1540(+)